jgi:hypothetical protein
MGIEQEISEIIHEREAEELAQTLLKRTQQLQPPSQEDRDKIARILEDVCRELPCHEALWIAFWLGCAWQNATDEPQSESRR